jgi:hypothetical protein
MKANFPTQIRSAALGLAARVSCALALATLVAACAQPAPQESAYQLWNYSPPVATPAYYQQRPATPDYGDAVIPTPASPAPAPAPPPEQKTAEAQPAPAPAPNPVAPPADPSGRSPTCGAWRLGCGILWQ